MSRRWLVWGLLLCFWAPAAVAQDGPEAEFRLRFRVYPPDAEVYRLTGNDLSDRESSEYVGPATGLRLKVKYAQQPCYFTFQRPGFRFDRAYGWDQALPIRSATGNLFDYFPIDGEAPIQGEPNSHAVAIWTYLIFHPKILLAPVLMAIGLGLLARRYRRDRAMEQSVIRKRESLVALSTSTDPLIGQIIEGYLILDRLGQGATATVYKAVPNDTLDLEHAVAIKMMKGNYAEDPDFYRKFQHQIQVSADLKHPYIVRVDNWGERDGILYMVLEYISGQTLEQKIPNQGWTLEEAMLYLGPILEALIYAHGRGVVHRDLKPENVMISDNGARKVMEFGLMPGKGPSRIESGDSDPATWSYRAPEQIAQGLIRPACDQYALGVIAYRMLTGHLPYDSKSRQRKLHTPPGEIKPERLREILLRMMNPDPLLRYPSLEVVREGLLTLASGEPWEDPTTHRAHPQKSSASIPSEEPVTHQQQSPKPKNSVSNSKPGPSPTPSTNKKRKKKKKPKRR